MTETPAPATGGRTARPYRTWLGYGVIGIVVAICATGWAVVMLHANGGGTDKLGGIEGQTISYRVQSDASVSVTFQILKPKSARVKCLVRAQEPSGRVVGATEVAAGPGKTTSVQRIELPTDARATTAEIRDCTRS